MMSFKIKPGTTRLNLKNPLHFLAVGLCPASPKAPGTMGDPGSHPAYLLVSGCRPPGSSSRWWWVSWRASASAERHRRHRDAGSRAIVWDEVIGFGVTMIVAPAGWEWVLAGFVLFRLFDVLKPWPISWFDRRIHGGLGIMLTISSPACLPPGLHANCLPTGEGGGGSRTPVSFVFFHLLAKRSDIPHNAGPEGPAFLYAILPAPWAACGPG